MGLCGDDEDATNNYKRVVPNPRRPESAKIIFFNYIINGIVRIVVRALQPRLDARPILAIVR